jgi:pyruvate dehydrogenase E2 component (dihydrolipoamide acetyltransferase)
MPSLGVDMRAGTLVGWKVKPGDRIQRGDVIATVETDKANVDVEIYENGIVDRLAAKPGDKLPVGTLLAVIRGEGERAALAKRIAASPLARRKAREFGIDLATLTGTGPHGVIEAADVEGAVQAVRPSVAPTAAPPPTAATPTGMRRAIAAAMARSNREIPHYYLETRIDMQAALSWLERVNRERSVKDRILPAALLVKAVAVALTEVPEFNGYWINDEFQMKEAINIGMAISLRSGGLVIPAIHDVDEKSVGEVMEAIHDLITRAREGGLRSSELTDGTITVTNLGDLGVETVFGVIYPPQVALVGFGRIAPQARVAAEMIGILPVLSATLAADHRATDGHRGAQFLTALDAILQDPDKL